MDENDEQLFWGVFRGDFDGVKAALEAGANVDGPPELASTSIVSATIADNAGMVEFLLEQGADPDRPVTQEVKYPKSKIDTTILGERALHIAARTGNVEIVRVLLARDRADSNAIDSRGYTVLMATCESAHVCAEVMWLLLEAGADPTLAAEDGFIPLHIAALKEDMDLLDMLCSRAPATLNRRTTADGATPLFMACGKGNERMVSKLLSLGAMQPMTPRASDTCPLMVAVIKGFVGVVRVLINEGGVRAVGGEIAFAEALQRAVEARPLGMLRLMLGVDGEERRSEWANTYHKGTHLLHVGADRCHPAVVSILLKAGADEAARDREGRFARDMIGRVRRQDELQMNRAQMDQGNVTAIRRMLQRGPAYRARSWAWPSEEEGNADGSGDGDTAVAAAVLSSPPAVYIPPVLGVRIFRPKEKSSSKFFVRTIGRYCAKD
ncbi:unnamed protein product [Laminaria digitata]